MAAPKEISSLVERFDREIAVYKSAHYNEAQLRREFLDPFFKALGWDIDNEQGYAEPYKDVVHEDAIKVGEATKAPDYCFRIGGTRKFFLEAKKPAVDIKNDASPAFQLRRYAWTCKLPLSVLSDFEEFAVYDCRVKPDQRDHAATARVLYIPHTEYVARWEEIAGVFSREAVLKGSFDRFAESTKSKRGTADVDAEFLKTIEGWREELARNFALRNPQLSQRELNFAVQRTIDRVIFLRICEGRGLEDYGRLQALSNGDRIYPRLAQLFEQADDRYNSGLFHFKPEPNRHEASDELTLGLELDDKLLREILKSLYYPESPYVFSALSSDILGQVYEQFLGKIIRLTEGHRAVVEEKPEVKKAGGVYYTPAHIVEYIVQTTIGALLADQTLRQAAELKVVDPACGSGSFLLGAYEFLLQWHLEFYVKNAPAKRAKGARPVIVQTTGGWKLTIDERKRILLANIHGVDIDPQAVETTKLSLLLKVLEGETQQSLQPVLRMFQGRALPDLAGNIKCGNSLVGPDFYEQQQMALFDDEARYRLNVFDWQAEFRSVFARGGFDAVIGNPPYIRIQTMRETRPKEADYLTGHYEAARHGNYDVYVVFVERGLSLLNQRGRLGFILPHKFFNAEYGQPLRSLLSRGKHLEQIVHFGHNQVFASATTYTCLLFLGKSPRRKCRFAQVEDLSKWIATRHAERGELLAEEINGVAWRLHVGPAAKVMARLANCRRRLADVARLFVGLQTDADEVFILEERGRRRGQVRCFSAATEREHWFEAAHLKPFLKGSLDVRRYALSGAAKLLLFPYHKTDGASSLIPAKEYAEQFPLTWAYLEANKPRLSKRAKGSLGVAWYGYVYKKNHLLFEQPKILAPAIARGACFAWDAGGKYYFVGSGGGGGGGYGIVPDESTGWSPLFFLGLLNSRLSGFYLTKTSTVFRGGYIALNRQYIASLPLPVLDTAQKPGQLLHEQMTELVGQMLELHPRLDAARTPTERSALERQIAAADNQIDRAIYDLYGLSEEEIKIVESA